MKSCLHRAGYIPFVAGIIDDILSVQDDTIFMVYSLDAKSGM